MTPDNRRTVLVVDDSQTILQVVNTVLTHAGYRVVTAASGETGLSAARTQAPDLILLDIMMPGIDGYTMLTKLQQFASVPVVVMSGKGESELGDLFLGKVSGWLQKPFSPSALIAEVEQTIGRPTA